MRFLFSLVAVGLISACAPNVNSDSSPARIAAAAYTAPAPRSLTLFTVVNNRTGSGGHTALMVNGSQQVLFDPAGSFRDERVVESGDVIFGMTPAWVQAYKSAHARSTYHVVSQEIPVTPEQAERALQLVRANGSVGGAYCARATTGILQQVPGFGSIDRTFYPVKLMEQVATLPGVTTTRYYEDDSGDVIDALRAAELAQAQ